MKKLFILLVISALLLISAFAAENTVYVSDGGTGDGSSASAPLGTLADAYAALGDDGGKIVITDTVSIATSFVEPSHSGKVTLTGGTLAATDVHYMLNGPTTFENITLKGNNKYLLIVAQFNPVVFGEGITVTGFGNFITLLNSVSILGGTRANFDKYNDDTLIGKDTNITFKSGKAILVGYSYGVNKNYTGTANINIEGGTLCNIYTGAITGIGGNVNMNVSGGTFMYNIYSSAKSSKVAGNINIKVTGGDFSSTSLTRFDGSMTGTGTTSVVDFSEYKDYSVVASKLESFTTVIPYKETTTANLDTVYVTDGGTGDGSSKDAPVGTLADAYAALGDDGGKIVITDQVTLTSKFVEPTHSGKVTITGGTLALNSIRFVLNGATTFENLTMHGNGSYLSLIAQFNPVVFGEGITVTGFGDFSSIAKGIVIVGGVLSGEGVYDDSTLLGNDTNITIKSGKAIIISFCRNVDKAFTGTAHVNIEGGTLYNIYMGADVGSGGNVEMNISGGTFIYNIYSNAKISKLTGNVNVKITGGDFSATTLTRFDGSVTGESATSVADVRGLANYSTVVEKMEGFKKIITDEGEILPDEKLAIQDAFLYGSFTASDGTVLPYRYYLPDGYETSGKDYPVVLYMHGNGSRGTNNTSQLGSYSINTAIYESDYECIMITPQCPSSPYEWTLYSTVGKNVYPGSEEYAKFLESGEPYGSKYFCAATELLDKFLTDYRADTSKVYLAGSSNGTGAVWNLMTLYPEVFAAAIPVSGSRAEDDYVHAVAHRMKNIAIWAFHGDLDTSASGSPVEGTRTMAAAIKAVGGNITYTEVVGGNHSNIWKIAADTPGVVDWLFAQTNDSFKNTLSGAKGAALPAPTNLTWNNSAAAWDAVENAGAYKVTFYIDGTEAKTYFTCQTSYVPDFEALGYGNYTFTVRAFPVNNTYSIGGVSATSAAFDSNADNTTPSTVYVAENGAGTGLTSDSPMSSLSDAYAKLTGGGEIVIVGNYTVSATTLPEAYSDVTIRGGSLTLNGDVAFAKNTNSNVITLDLPVTSNGASIFGGFNSIVFGENFEVTGNLDFYGGVDALPGTQGEHDANYALNITMVTELPYTITVKNGTFNVFAGGNKRAYNDTTDSAYKGDSDLVGSISAPLTVEIDGGIFNGTFSLSGNSILADDATLTVNGGTFNGAVYAQANIGPISGYASYCTRFVMTDKKYFAVDGDIDITINDGNFSGGLISAYELDVAYTQCLRGDFNLTISENATFASGTVLDATQVKAYDGENKAATLTCPDASKFEVVRFDKVNGETVKYDEPLRISFIGDSITQGTGSSDQLTKSYSAQFALLCESAGKEVIIGNYGVGGSTILSYGNGYYNKTLAYSIAFNEADSDYVLIALGTNDASAAGGTVGQMMNFTEKYETFVKSFGDLPDTEKVFTTSAIYRLTSQKAADVRAVSVVRPTQKHVMDKLVAEEADKYFYIDLYALLYDAAVTDTLFAGDKLHPDDGGYVIYAQAIYDAIFNDVRTVENFEMSDVYLSASGKLAGAGTLADPMSSLTTALGRLAPDGTLHIIGEYTYPEKIVTPRFMEKLTIIGEGSGAKLYINGNTVSFLSDTKLDNFMLDTTYTNANYLAFNWNNVEITETFDCNAVYRFLAGQVLYYNDISKTAYDSPVTASSDKDITVTVNGGTYYIFVGGNWRMSADCPFGTYSGNMTLNIGKGATIKANGYNGIGGQNYLKGTVTANIDSWPSGQLCRDYPRIGAQNTVNVFNESNNTGTTVMNFGEGVNATPIITGDFDGDDKVTMADAMHLLKLAIEHDDGTEIHDFYSFKSISLVNVIRVFKKLI